MSDGTPYPCGRKGCANKLRNGRCIIYGWGWPFKKLPKPYPFDENTCLDFKSRNNESDVVSSSDEGDANLATQNWNKTSKEAQVLPLVLARR